MNAQTKLILILLAIMLAADALLLIYQPRGFLLPVPAHARTLQVRPGKLDPAPVPSLPDGYLDIFPWQNPIQEG